MSERYDAFISCVSAEFQPEREQIAAELRKKGWHVSYQEEFSAGPGGGGIEKLKHYLESSRVVICLVGDAYGWPPPAEDPHRGSGPERSLTQLEFEWAWAKRESTGTSPFIVVFTPDDKWTAYGKARNTRDYRIPDAVTAARHQNSQPEHLARVQKKLFTESFSTSEELIRKVLHLELPLPPRAPIVHLPVTSLGAGFIGRRTDMDVIEQRVAQHLDRFAQNRDHVETWPNHIIQAYGGMGKTRLVYEYAHRNQARYRAVLGISLSSAADLEPQLASLAEALQLGLPAEMNVGQRSEHVLQWLHDHAGWLLIIDNVDDPAALPEIENLFSRLSHGHVLLTTRLVDWHHATDLIQLDYLPLPEAADLLAQSAGRPTTTDRPAAESLALSLDRLALALEMAGLYMRQKGIAYAAYAQLLSKQPDYYLAHGHEQSTYHQELATAKELRSLWKTHRITFEVLPKPARFLLETLSYFASAPIPESLFHPALLPAACLSPDDPPAPAADQPCLDPPQAIATLRAYGFLADVADPPARRVPSLIQIIVREAKENPPHPGALPAALKWLDGAFEGDPQDVRSWPTLVPLLPHAIAAAGCGEKREIAEPTTRLLNHAGLLLYSQAQFPAAEPLYRSALKLNEAHYGPNHSEVASTLTNLAQLLKATNRLTEVEPMLERVVSILQKKGGDPLPNYSGALNKLAQLLPTSNLLTEAEPSMRRALAIAEASFGPDHPNVVFRLNNLASLLQATNRLTEAEPLMRRALAIDEASLGPDHPNVAIRLHKLAGLLKVTNRLPEAQLLMERVVEISEKAYGKDHPNVAAVLIKLAHVLQATDRPTEAEPLVRRALAIDEASFGPDHTSVAGDLNNLACLLQATNRLTEAEPLMRRAVHISTASLGPEHPNTITGRKNLAILLEEMDLAQN